MRRVRKVMSLCLILLWPRIKIRFLSDYFFTNIVSWDLYMLRCIYSEL